jgi:hypothetical protein
MGKRKWIAGTSATLLVLLLMACYMAFAAETANPDDTSAATDPLVSLSYLTDVLAPQTVAKVNEVLDEKADAIIADMNQKLTDFTADLDAKIANFDARNANIATDSTFIAAVTNSVLAQLGGDSIDGDGGVPTGVITGTGWHLVDVAAGETYKFEVGGMVLLRLGSADCYNSAPGLIDVTAATELSGGDELQKNHLYIVTVAERGFTATSGSKILVSGSYTVS